MKTMKFTLSAIALVAIVYNVYTVGFTLFNIGLLVLFGISLLGEWAAEKKKQLLAAMTPEEAEAYRKAEEEVEELRKKRNKR